MKKSILYIFAIFAIYACSDFDEQEFTVLLPNAGIDQVLFTEESGTSIQLDGLESSDVNNLGFNYQWEVLSSPENFPINIDNATIANPTFEVSNEVSGRYELSLIISRGDQVARDFVNIDVNPAIAQVLFVNAVDSPLDASFAVPSVTIQGNPVASKNADDTYYNIDNNVAIESDGTVLFEVNYNGAVLTTNQTLEALGSYTLYLVGTEANPELLFIEKTRNQNTIGLGQVSLDAINLAEGSDNVVLFIDGRSINAPLAPVDLFFQQFLGITDAFGVLNYQDNGEISIPSNPLLPLPIFATINNIPISNETAISLIPGADGSFGTFILFPDASAPLGHRLTFINNSSLLPQ